MKLKNHLLFILFSIWLLLFGSLTLQSQVVNPTLWSDFVKSNNNAIVTDTFMMQTFTEDITNNWPYKVTGKTSLFDPKTEGITDCHDGSALQLFPGSTFSMTDINHHSYSEVRIYAIYAAWRLMKGDNLYLSTERKENPANDVLWLAPPNNYSKSFRQHKPESKTNVGFILLLNDPWNMQLRVNEPTGETTNGFYAVDSVYAYGKTRLNSLFTGTGEWHDFSKWSHHPAMRHRNALINGKVTINDFTYCNLLSIGTGSVTIGANQSLSMQNLNFYSNEASLYSSGDIHIKEKVTVYRTFDQPGKWYFISFPFDVYADGLDPAFQLGDDQTSDSGNYIYLQTYNGKKRSMGSTENWEIVPSSITMGNQPVFEKNKGYLIALDENADTQTLSFSSQAAAITSDFGRSGTIPVYTGIKGNKVDEADHGWYLCGNPMPAPLPLSSIESNNALDGNIYVYENDVFKPYPLDGNYAIPPFSAFFAKAENDTELTIRESSPLKSNIIISSTLEPLTSTKVEPHASRTSPVYVASPLTQTQNSYLNLNSLVLEHIITPGVVYMVDYAGRVIWQKEVKAGSSVLNLPPTLPEGLYILSVETSQYRAQHKFVLSH